MAGVGLGVTCVHPHCTRTRPVPNVVFLVRARGRFLPIYCDTFQRYEGQTCAAPSSGFALRNLASVPSLSPRRSLRARHRLSHERVSSTHAPRSSRTTTTSTTESTPPQRNMATAATARSFPAAALETPPAREVCSQSGREPLCELGKEGSQQAGVKRALPTSHHTSCSVHKIRLRVDNAEGLAWRLGVEPAVSSLLEPTTEDCRLEADKDADAHMDEVREPST